MAREGGKAMKNSRSIAFACMALALLFFLPTTAVALGHPHHKDSPMDQYRVAWMGGHEHWTSIENAIMTAVWLNIKYPKTSHWV